MYSNESIKTILNGSLVSPNNKSFINFPLHLLLSVDFSKNQDSYVISNLLKFFNISLNENNNETTNLTTDDFLSTKNIIDYLNFIRFKHENQSSSNLINQREQNCINNNGKITIPSFSIILLTNNAVINKQARQIMENDDAIRMACEQNNRNLLKTANSNWSYNHKIELNDEFGKTMARQLYFKLNFNNNINKNQKNSTDENEFPLCCRTMWVSPKCGSNNPSSCKYIIRLNINCKNYDLMLFFYRLLFDKCPNYSKKDFSLFVLKDSSEKINIEFQLSLKNDTSVLVNQLKNASLVYNIAHRSTFDNVTRLLNGYLEEIVKNKVYAVYDPDHNKIFLVDGSNNVTNNGCFNSVGLAEKYLSTLMYHQNQTNAFDLKSNYNTQMIHHEKNLSCSPNSNTSSSSSETHSFDSGRDSGRWSCSAVSTLSNSNNSPPSASPPNVARKEKILNNENMTNKMDPLKNKQSEANDNKSDDSNFNSVKDLIKKFNCNNNKIMNNCVNIQSICNRSTLNRLPSYSANNFNQKPNEENDDYDLELEQLLKRATNNSMHALNEMTLFKNKLQQQQQLETHLTIERPANSSNQHQITNRSSRPFNKHNHNNKNLSNIMTNPLYQRSYSVLNEPIVKNINNIHNSSFNQHSNNNTNNNNQNLQMVNVNNQLVKSALLNGSSDLFNRKKSKSVTFMDSIGMNNTNSNSQISNILSQQQANFSSNNKLNKTKSFYSNSLLDSNNKHIDQYLYYNKNQNIERQRSKSTLPFMCSSSTRYIDVNRNNYPCFNNNEYDYQGEYDYDSEGENDDEDENDEVDDNTSVDLVNGSDCLLVADVDDDDTYVRIPASHVKKQKEQYKLILQKQQEQLFKKQQQLLNIHRNNDQNSTSSFPIEFNRNCLIDNQKHVDQSSLLKKKPDVGITAKTRFRRSHTLDLLRSTRMPLRNETTDLNHSFNNTNTDININNKIPLNKLSYLKKKTGNTHSSNNNLIEPSASLSSSYLIKINQHKQPPIKV